MSQTELNDDASDQVSPELYGENYYAHDLGLPYERNDHWLSFFGGVADRIVAELAPTTSLDVGCAFGFLVEALRDRGVDAKGNDFSEYAVSQAGGSAVGHCTVRSALEPIHDRYDLISCVEVIEHIEQGQDRVALQHMANATDRILLSSTPFDFAEPTHINVQPPEYWAELMASLGFYRDLDYDASYLTSWAGLFVRREPTTRDVVKAYERSEWNFRCENRTLRQELIKIHAMTSQQAEGSPAAESAIQKRLDETLVRLAAAEHDVRVARDAAVGAEATSGALRAKLHETQVALHAAHTHQQEWNAALEAGPMLYQEDPLSLRRELDLANQELREVKDSTTWKVAWKVLSPYRRLRK